MHQVAPSSPDIATAALAVVARGESLSRDQARAFMAAVLDGDVTPAQLGGVLLAIRVRTETTDELAGFVEAMRARVLVVEAPAGAIDTCGTGGDVHGTFNISTATSLVTAAAGVPVAKHGNRAVSSQSGSSDAIASLGLTVEQTVDAAEASLRETGYAYLHAPSFHPGMRHAGPVRRELGVRTAFNLCGPMANPALVTRQLMGVPDEVSAERVAQVLHAIGIERAFVVHGDMIDELPLDDSGVYFEVTPDGIRRHTVTAEDARPAARTHPITGGWRRRRERGHHPGHLRRSRARGAARCRGPQRGRRARGRGARGHHPPGRGAGHRDHPFGCCGRAARPSPGSGVEPRKG